MGGCVRSLSARGGSAAASSGILSASGASTGNKDVDIDHDNEDEDNDDYEDDN